MNVRVKPQQKRSDSTLRMIRAAAMFAIERKGRDHFTTADIAIQAGVSIGTLYRYYADRTAVLDDLFPKRTEGLGPLREFEND